jgi:cobalamin biosynthesis protein CobD/CbiB
MAKSAQAFDPATGEPAAWVTPEPVIVTWYQHAVAYAEMKWPRAGSGHRQHAGMAGTRVAFMLRL